MMPRRMRLGAAATAGALVVTLGLQHAALAADPSPTPTPTTDTEFVAPKTVDTYVGQSLQIRKDADGNPNSSVIDFRWAATQVNAESLKGVNAAVPLPMANAPGLRSLIGSDATPTTTEDGVIYSFSDVDGVDVYRTVNLWPEDQDTPVNVTAEFTLNGEKVAAQDIVGKGGAVTATYTVTNNTREKTDVKYTDVLGKPATATVETDQPMAAIGSALIPQGWAQFQAQGGTYGADGRGNYQTQWIALPFAPLSKTGTAKFGWAAVIPEGEGFVPQMVIEVAPIYIPPGSLKPKPAPAVALPGIPSLAGAGFGLGGRGITPPNFSEGIVVARDGVETMVRGFHTLSEEIAGARSVTQAKLQQAMVDTRAAVARLCLLIECGKQRSPLNLNAVISQMNLLSARLTTAINQISASGANVDKILAKLQETKTKVDGGLNKAQNALATAKRVQDGACRLDINGEPLNPALCEKASTAVGALSVVVPLLRLGSNKLSTVITQLPSAVGRIEVSLLTTLKVRVDGLSAKLVDAQQQLVAVKAAANELKTALGEFRSALQGGIAAMGGVEATLNEIALGKAELSAGLGGVSTEARSFIGRLAKVAAAAKTKLVKLIPVIKGKVAGAKAAAGQKIARLKQKVTELGKKANTMKAEVTGLIMRAEQSPLPYGGGTETVYATPTSDVNVVQVSEQVLAAGDKPVESAKANLQPSTKVFGAYQFVLDPATSDKPQTAPRIVISVLILLAAGLGLSFVRRRRVAARSDGA